MRLFLAVLYVAVLLAVWVALAMLGFYLHPIVGWLVVALFVARNLEYALAQVKR